MMTVQIEPQPNGEFVVTGLESGKWVPVTAELMPDVLQQSLEGAFYPYRFHEMPLRWDRDRRVYIVMIGDWE